MTHVEGDFSRGDVIAIRDVSGLEIARGLANYASAVGYVAESEFVHRDNLILTR